MSGFKCPFCGQIMSVSNDTKRTVSVSFSGIVDQFSKVNLWPYLNVDIYRCPNNACGKEAVIVCGMNGYIKEKTVQVYPESTAIQFPDYVPSAIRTDYEEACAIRDKSPKAAATLARRCLQGMIRDFWEITEKNLNAEITALKDKIPAAQWAAIDALRKIGNIGAHMEKDVDVIVDVEPDEAEKLVQLIELLIDKWYIARHDNEQLLAEVIDMAEKKETERKSGSSGK